MTNKHISDTLSSIAAKHRVPPTIRAGNMLALFVFLVLAHIVNSENICDSLCVCRYENHNEDFKGESIDCSYKNKAMETDYVLPHTAYSLDLSFNNLTQIQPSPLLKSPTMKVIQLNNNKITDIAMESFELPELRRLDLSDNLLESINERIFRDIRKLEYLNLANNRFTTFDKLTFHPLSNLNEVILNHNRLGPSLLNTNLFDRDGFGLNNKIQILSISNIGLSRVHANFFSDAFDMRKLDISFNNLTDIFQIPYTLDTLDLSGNPISVISGDDFTDLPALRILKLNELNIEEVPDYVFSELSSLYRLELERNMNLTTFGPYAFGRQVLYDTYDFEVEHVSLKGSRVTTLDEQLSVLFERLTVLDLQGNPWDCDCRLLWIKKLKISPRYTEHFRCGSPKPLYNSRVFDLKSKYFVCGAVKQIDATGIAVILSCVSIMVLGIWVFIVTAKSQTRRKVISSLCNPSAAYSVLPMSVITRQQ